MSLPDLMRDVVTIRRVDDRQKGRRGGAKDDTSEVVASGVRCRIHDLGPERVMLAGREMERITHKFHFATPRPLDTTHRLEWTDPDTGADRKAMVVGTKRPKAPSMPWIAYAEEQVT